MILLNEAINAADAYTTQLEAANEELKKAIRKQLATLVKPLGWSKSLGIWTALGAGFDYSYADDKPRLFIRDLRDNRTPSTFYPGFAEARAAAEAHHIETVLSLLNI